jgi:hypothetical protein
MPEVDPRKLVALGSALLVVSWMMLLLMVIGQIPRHLLLSVAAYAASVAGFAVGMFGVVMYVRRRRGPGGPNHVSLSPGERDEG